MSEISKKQTKTEELHNYPLDVGIFRKVFNGYVQKFNAILLTLVLLICAPFAAYLIAWYLEMTKVDITGFLDIWHATGSLMLDWGFPHINYKVISLEIVSLGLVSCGVVSIGAHVSCGVISIGTLCSCGVISIGGWSSFGVIALGNNNVYGVVAIATGNKKPFEKNTYMNGKAFGLIAIGRQARGVYALSYGDEGEGTYQFSPACQDPEAVALFTRWFKKFKGAFVSPS